MIYKHLFRDSRIVFCNVCRILNNEFKSNPIRFVDTYSKAQNFIEQTHTCDTVNESFVGQEIRLCGWLDGEIRQNKYLILRDGFGTIQLVFSHEKEKEVVNVLKTMNNERLIEVTGILCTRKTPVSRMKNGHIEVAIKELVALESKPTTIPGLTSTLQEIDRSVNAYTSRTHTCGELRSSNAGEEVKLCGWVEFVRVNRFIFLRDAYGTVQIRIENMDDENSAQVNVHLESVIQVIGIVRATPEQHHLKNVPTSAIEVQAKSINVLNEAFPKTRFQIRDYGTVSDEKLRNRNCQTSFAHIETFGTDLNSSILNQNEVKDELSKHTEKEIDVNQDLAGYEKCDPFRMQEIYNELIDKNHSYEQIFTDASKIQSQIGYAIKHRDTIVARKLPPSTKLSTAEMLAIREGLLYILSRKDISAALIISDSLGSIRAIQAPTRKNKLAQEIRELFYVGKLFGIKIQLWWVPSHCGIEGNEAVDQLAKNVTKSEQPVIDDILCTQDANYPVKVRITEKQREETNQNIENEYNENGNQNDYNILSQLKMKVSKMAHQAMPRFSRGNSRLGVDAIVFGSHDYQHIRKRYRFLALRFPQLQNNLRTRSDVLFKMRKFLISKKFVEVETPTLFKRTPVGAQEFIVPTRFKNRFYSLIQSPQQLKQLLMAGSLDRYFQIARCYKDEKTHPEWQPEFTQLDIELSFTNADSVMKLTEDVLIASWPQNKNSIFVPFPRMTYDEAIDKYGSCRPCLFDKLMIHNMQDYTKFSEFVYMFIVPEVQSSSKKWKLRFDSLRLDPLVKVYVVKTRTKEKSYLDIQNIFPDFRLDIFENHFPFVTNDLVIFSAGPTQDKTLRTLGACRHDIIDELNMIDELNENGIYEFAWIIDSPLFKADELGELKSVHHLFTHPHSEDANLLPSQAIKVRSLSSSLILNGFVIGCGSMCIHSAELQKTIFKLLKLREEDFSYILEALEMGYPPSGGIALDIDRLLAIICNCKSIQDVVAFPKAEDGQDLMTQSPNDIPLADKIRYHICSAD